MAKKDLPIFDIEMCEDGCGLDYISLVKSPAIEIMALAFDKDVEKINFSFNKFSQIVAGPAMVPDKLIYRNDPDMGEFYVRFTKEVIAKLAEKFNKTAKEIKINMDHKTEVPSAFVLGNWIIEDSEKDKANYKYGFKDLPVGTWFVEVKIDDSKVFEDEVIDNLKNGFSVEGLFDLSYASFIKTEELELVITPESGEDEDTFIERCMSIETKSFEQEQAYAICKNKYDNKFKKEEKMENKLKFAAHKLEDGTTIYASDLAVGAEVYTIDENLERVPVFDGTHKLTDGKTISTVDGKITEVKDAMEMAVETEEEVVKEVVEVPEVVEDEVDVMTAITPKLDELWMAIAELTSKVEGMSLPEKKEEFKTDKPTFHETFSNVLSNLKKLNK
jgi:copper chaperone CopZ